MRGALARCGARVLWAERFEDAERYSQESLALRERLAPESWVVAASHNTIGITLNERGDLAAAEARYARALSILERLSPENSLLPQFLNNAAIAARQRGDFARCEEVLRRALDLRNRLAPSGDRVTQSLLEGLGQLALQQGDLDRAQAFLEKSMALGERLWATPPQATDVASLGVVAEKRGDLAKAEEHYRRSLSLVTKPDGQEAMLALFRLAALLRRRGRLDEAEPLARKSLALAEAIAPASLDASHALEVLGEVLAAQGRRADAQPVFERCLELRRRCAPGSAAHAGALVHLARLARSDGEAPVAVRLYGEALDLLDKQTSRLAGSQETRLAFGRGFDPVYREAITLLLDQRREAEALHVLERSRARSFLAMLDERDLVDADVPPELDRRRRRADAAYDRALAELGRLDAAKDSEKVRSFTARLAELRHEQAAIRAEIRRASPRADALRNPEPLDLPGVRAAMDPGSVLLSYSVGDERTHLFVIEAGSDRVQHVEIPLGREPLEKRVRAFRERIARSVAVDPVLDREASALYDALLRPADAALTAAERVVLCPDGPLHTLSFAALRRRGMYVAEWKPLHTVTSATVYAELRKGRGMPGSRGPIVAFADPRYPLRASADPEAVRDATLRDGLRRGLNLTALPASRREAESIGRLYGKDARLFVGDLATEERAKSETRGARYVHFACHGFVDERLPLNSGLALATRAEPKEGQDNGLLQAWEVFERVRVDADLVTLSACDTGLGKEMGGEGLIGLTRAFQYAGARSVVASLWPAPDRSTADLMRTFYEGLRKGLPKDEALRQAQVAAIRKGTGRAHPFRWAGFQLFGDWR